MKQRRLKKVSSEVVTGRVREAGHFEADGDEPRPSLIQARAARTLYGMADLSRAAAVYRSLPADERQEFRLPALLKDHLARVVSITGQTMAEYITTAIAERVSQDLAATTEWALPADEQVALLKMLAGSRPSERAVEVAARARALFGDLPPTEDR